MPSRLIKVLSKIAKPAVDMGITLYKARASKKETLDYDISNFDPDAILKSVGIGNDRVLDLPTIPSIDDSIPSTPSTSTVPKVKTCLDCLNKHLNTAKVFSREAIQRFEANEPEDRVLERVRGIVEELSGAEADTNGSDDESIREINTKLRKVRKGIWASGLEIQNPKNKDELLQMRSNIEEVLNDTYTVAKAKKEEVLGLVNKIEERTKSIKETLV